MSQPLLIEHDDARVAVALEALEIDVERIDQRGIERVEVFGTIERHPVDAVIMLDQQWLGHALSPRRQVPVTAPSPLVVGEGM